ncbi:hypothetical protein SPRG_03586 [Saprolegnia parasitica CBS 223.65]|uniref:Uncharacterized protein n=1 Tax=Saprolegnia parasitica (strain CBS 223.65) TaxID=695850 RepID=A0A067CY23_SAPPC|nr:hypothetical protein SPRG_03586 [Saprolegnia parasitica CBS 223.65]KDO31667.1 hypothetical protein SPRG_03586 [Saprolegnia parasitica CBS 223.65]|eukprot:XP_012197555.1 hypothetical protein SPRG_03586 [Saprolegnia parasitica CBS 223.65]
MGNTESCRGLASELDRLESTLSVLAATNPVGIRPLRSHQVHVHGAVLDCSLDVRVTIGPVVGVVGPNKARILLEVNTATTITCHLTRQERWTGQFLEVPSARVAVAAPAGAPVVFVLTQLLPDTTYYYAFSGLCTDDARTCHGTFHTLAVDDTSPLQIAVVSGQDAFAAGESDLWQQLAARVQQRVVASSPETTLPVQYVLHLGGQIALQRTFEQGYVLLTRHAQSLSTTLPSTRTWETMEAKVVELFRDAYRFQWRLPFVRDVLAHASNVMMWGDCDVYANFAHASVFQMDHERPTLHMQVMRILLRSARRVFHEYQRQLWDDDFAAFSAEMASATPKIARRIALAEGGFRSTHEVAQRQLELAELEQTMAVSKRRMEFAATKMYEQRVSVLRAELDALQLQAVAARDELLVVDRGEEFCLWTERHIAFLFLDMRGSHLAPGGVPTPDNPVWSPAQWDFVMKVLAEPRTRVLVVCSELPIADANSESVQALLASEPTSSYWKVERPNRLVVLLSGASATRWPIASVVTDVTMRASMPQYVVGPMTMAPSTTTLPALSAALGDRFVVTHTIERPLETNFALCQLTASADRDPTLHVTRHRQMASTARVLVGPIVGLVDAFSSVILLEVDRDASVTCLVTNVVTGATQRLLQKLPARRPKSFHFTQLAPQQHYSVTFLGIAEPSTLCHFATPAERPSRFDLALVSHDRLRSFPLTPDTSMLPPTLWSSLEASLAEPFSALTLVLHLGGQIYPREHACVDAARAMLHPVAADTDLVDEQLRNVYRHHWTLPTTRNALALGAHLMVPSEVDVLELPEGIARPDRPADTAALSVRLKAIASEYQLQLWPASSVKPYPFCHAWGPFGLFVWPKTSIDVRWSALAAFLAQPSLTTLVVACDQPLVDDSVEDLREKAKTRPYGATFPGHADDLLRLLDVLSQWHRKDDAKQVVFVCGHEHFGFDTVLQDAVARHFCVRQFVVGSLSTHSTIEQRMAYLSNGSIGTTMTFAHNFDASYLGPHFGHLTLRPTELEAYEVVTLAGDESSLGGSYSRTPAASWYLLPQLPAWLPTVTPLEPRSSNAKLDALLSAKAADVVASYTMCHVPTQCRKSRFAVAQALLPGVERFYECGGLDLRVLVPPPTLFTITRICATECKIDALGYAVDVDLYCTILAKAFRASLSPEPATLSSSSGL